MSARAASERVPPSWSLPTPLLACDGALTGSPKRPAPCPPLAHLPRSAIDPAAARVDFINALTAQLWPHAERAASRLMLKDGFLERLL